MCVVDNIVLITNNVKLHLYERFQESRMYYKYDSALTVHVQSIISRTLGNRLYLSMCDDGKSKPGAQCMYEMRYTASGIVQRKCWAEQLLFAQQWGRHGDSECLFLNRGNKMRHVSFTVFCGKLIMYWHSSSSKHRSDVFPRTHSSCICSSSSLQ